MRTTILVAVGTLVGAVTGFFIGGIGNDEIKNTARIKPPVQGEVLSTQSTQKAQTTPQTLPSKDRHASGTEVIRLPKKVINSLPSALVFDTAGSIQPESLSTYGVPPERRQSVRTLIDDARKKFQKVEVEHSQLVKTASGDQFFLLNPFPEVAAKLRDALMTDVRAQFEGLDDDRAELLCAALAKSPKISEFGKKSTEVWFQEIHKADGKSEWQAVEKNTSAGAAVSVHPIATPQAKERLAGLIEKHLP